MAKLSKNPSPSRIKPLLCMYDQDIPESLKGLNPGDEVEVTALLKVLGKSVGTKGVRSIDAELGALKVAKPAKKGR